MKLVDYIRDKFISICFVLLCYFLSLVLFVTFDINKYLIILISLLFLITYLIVFLLDYFKRRSFYNLFKHKLDSLDKKYLICEVIKDSSFLDGNLLISFLYEINKCFIEEVNNYKFLNSEFKEYIELWCHEIKTPIATAKLLIENNKKTISSSFADEIEKIDRFVEQVLFYARSDDAYKDYLVSKVNLDDVISEVIKMNKKDLIEKRIKIIFDKSSVFVYSDAKWLIFMINQVIINSIKYSKDEDAFIKIYTNVSNNNVTLYIEDNGLVLRKMKLLVFLIKALRELMEGVSIILQG